MMLGAGALVDVSLAVVETSDETTPTKRAQLVLKSRGLDKCIGEGEEA